MDSRNSARGTHMEMMGRAEGKKLRGFWPSFCRYFLLGLTCIVCASSVCAQAPPDSAQATWDGGHAVNVIFTACGASDKANCACPPSVTTNCYPNNDFSIYRNPPGFTQLLTAGPEDVTVYQHTYTDTSVTPGKTYTYMVCGGGYAKGSKSNCIYTNSVPVPKPPPPPPPPPPPVTLTASTPIQTYQGWQTTLSWTCPYSYNAFLVPLGATEPCPTGSTAVSFSQTTTYTISVSGPNGNHSTSATLYVPTTYPCPPIAPPQNLANAPYSAAFKWTNPKTGPITLSNGYQPCP